MQAKNKLDSVQVARAVACLPVVAHHAFRATTVFLTPPPGALLVPAAWLIELGAAGVDVFFVISGFLMTYISSEYISNHRPPTDFLGRRIVRIWPPYVIVTCIACLPLLLPLFHHKHPFDLTPHRLASFFFVPSFNEKGQLQPIVGPGWTLNYEMLFYACFTVVLFFRRDLIPAGLVLLLTTLFTFGLLVPNAVTHQFLGNPILFEFLFGAIIGFTRAAGKLPAKLAWLWIVAAAVAFLGFVRLGLGVDQRLLAYGLPAALLLVGLLALENQIAWSFTFVAIGDASYAIYLTHIFAVQRCTSLARIADRLGLGRLTTVTVASVVILAAVVVGLLFYRFVERPITRWCYARYKVLGGLGRTRATAASPKLRTEA